MSRLPLAAAFVASALLAVAAFAWIPLRGDMAELLPEGRTEAARLMLREVRSGAAASLILVGIEGGPEARLADISDRMAKTLAGDERFAFAQNGRGVLGEEQIASLFARRYLLSPAVDAAAFETPALRRDFERLLDGLQSSASPLVQEFGLADPTGAFPVLIAAWTGASRVRSAHGVWFAESGSARALMLVRIRATGVDFDAQDAAIGAVRRAFAQADEGAGARLLLAGPAVFARDVSAAIRDDVRFICVVSIALVAGLLVWRFRSPWVLAAIAVPVLLGVAAAAAVTAWRFGFVHGVTLGFGATMLGVTVDYPVLLIGHRKQRESAAGTWARIGPTFRLAVLTAATGLSGMIFADVPGVAQLGLFAVVGLLAAAAATRFLLPWLIVTAGLAPVGAGDPALLRAVERWRRFRPAGVVVAAAAALLLAAQGGPVWQRDLASLTPVPAAALALDAELRGQLGAPEPGQLIVVRGGSEEEALRREEALRPELDRLIADGVIGGVEMAAGLLPSAARQQARQAALPEAAVLAARVAEARAGLPFTDAAFRPFEDDVAAARAMTALQRSDLDDPLLAARLDALLVRRDGVWLGLIAPREVRDPVRLAAALAGRADLTFVDIGRETGALVGGYARTAWPLLAGGAAVSVLALFLALRDPWRVARVLAAIAASLLVTVAALTAAGVRLTLIHVVSLQFVAGVGLDYALFFARAQVDEEERARTLRTLVTCVSMALLSFGLLSLCRTPLLQGIGATVAVGVASAMAFAFLFAGPKIAA